MARSGVDAELQHEIEQFLYAEARLLDTGRLYEWLELFTEDTRYWMPIRETLDEHTPALGPDELALALFDDDKQFLVLRVQRLDTGLAHAEMPRSRTRHLITNVQVEPAADGELVVYSSFAVYQGRLERSDHTFFGEREDRLRRLVSRHSRPSTCGMSCWARAVPGSASPSASPCSKTARRAAAKMRPCWRFIRPRAPDSDRPRSSGPR